MNPLDLIKSNSDALIGEESLVARLAAGRTLRVKLGVDPTRPDLTFGHLVVFNKLRQFQDLGHQAILIIGDYTTRVGDPSGRSDARPILSFEEIADNARTYLDQAFKVLDPARTIVRRNSEWFNSMDFMDCLRLARSMTVARMLERDDFAQRYAGGNPISIVEFLYPLLQGHDSVRIEADVELGGSDQLFNLLVGRQLQKEAGQPEQICLTMPLLVGLDGSKKMSKSAGNYIAFNDSPKDMFGKVMSIADTVMPAYYRFLLLAPDSDLAALPSLHPMEAKKQLAARLVDRFHGPGAGARERAQFEKVFAQNLLPDDIPALAWTDLAGDAPEAPLLALCAASGLFESKGEIRRLFSQGAIKLNQERAADPNFLLPRPAPGSPHTLQAGKRLFFQILS